MSCPTKEPKTPWQNAIVIMPIQDLFKPTAGGDTKREKTNFNKILLYGQIEKIFEDSQIADSQKITVLERFCAEQGFTEGKWLSFLSKNIAYFLAPEQKEYLTIDKLFPNAENNQNPAPHFTVRRISNWQKKLLVALLSHVGLEEQALNEIQTALLRDKEIDDSYIPDVVCPVLGKIKKEFTSRFLKNFYRELVQETQTDPTHYQKRFQQYCQLFPDFLDPYNGDAANLLYLANQDRDWVFEKMRSPAEDKLLEPARNWYQDGNHEFVLREIDKVFATENNPRPIPLDQNNYLDLWRYYRNHILDRSIGKNLWQRLAAFGEFDYEALKADPQKKKDLLAVVIERGKEKLI